MHYDSVYKNNPNFCGQKPNRLLIKIAKKLTGGGNFLDLGCGQGRDSFYMARKKFNVTSVDNSKVAISQIKNALRKKKIDCIQEVCQDISKFKIESNKFNIINCHNTLQFLCKKDALEIIKDAKKNILPGGFIAIASFTKNNPPSKRRKCHFEIGEMKKLFQGSKFRIIHYFEGTYTDSGHAGDPLPHKHGIVEIIAQKNKKTASE